MKQAEINKLRSRVGLHRGPLLGRQALTQEALEGQRIEIARLQEECAQRVQTLEGMLASLSAQCAELGEDLAGLAAEAHPSLRGLRCGLEYLPVNRIQRCPVTLSRADLLIHPAAYDEGCPVAISYRTGNGLLV